MEKGQPGHSQKIRVRSQAKHPVSFVIGWLDDRIVQYEYQNFFRSFDAFAVRFRPGQVPDRGISSICKTDGYPDSIRVISVLRFRFHQTKISLCRDLLVPQVSTGKKPAGTGQIPAGYKRLFLPL